MTICINSTLLPLKPLRRARPECLHISEIFSIPHQADGLVSTTQLHKKWFKKPTDTEICTHTLLSSGIQECSLLKTGYFCDRHRACAENSSLILCAQASAKMPALSWPERHLHLSLTSGATEQVVGGEEEHNLSIFSVSPSVLFSTFSIDFSPCFPLYPLVLYYTILFIFIKANTLLKKYMGSAKKKKK